MDLRYGLALSDQLAQDFLFLFVQRCAPASRSGRRQRAAQRLRACATAGSPRGSPTAARPALSGPLAPSPGRSRQFRRPRVVRKIEQPAAERIVGHRLLVADHARHQPRNGDRSMTRAASSPPLST